VLNEISLEDTISVLTEYNRAHPEHYCSGLGGFYLQFSRDNVRGLRKLLNRISHHIDGAGVRECDLEPGWTFDIFTVWDGYGEGANQILDYHDIAESLRVQYGVSDAVIYAACWAFDLPYRGRFLSYDENREVRQSRDMELAMGED
jgi:hypothetical protein